jgi:hypothetical protein
VRRADPRSFPDNERVLGYKVASTLLRAVHGFSLLHTLRNIKVCPLAVRELNQYLRHDLARLVGAWLLGLGGMCVRSCVCSLVSLPVSAACVSAFV